EYKAFFVPSCLRGGPVAAQALYCRLHARDPERESEATVKKWALALVVALTPTLLAQQPSVPEIPFDSTPNFFKLPPDMNFGEASGVAVNSKGDVAVYTRSNSAGG